MVQQQDGDDWRRGRQQHSSSSCRSSSSPRRRQDLVADVRVDDVVVNKRRLCLAREREHVRLRAILLVLLSQAQLEVSPFEVLVLALHLFQLFAQLAGSSVSEHLPRLRPNQSRQAGRKKAATGRDLAVLALHKRKAIVGRGHVASPSSPGPCSLGCTPCRLARHSAARPAG